MSAIDDGYGATAIARLVRNRRAQREPFRHVVSLGTSCYPAWLLKELGLRRTAHPFDWLFSSPEMVRAMLADRFRDFLDPAQFDPVPEAARIEALSGVCHHRGYRERFGVEHVFNHHDPSDRRGLAYFKRCVRRFEDVVAGPDKVFLLMIHPGPLISPALFADLCAMVDARGPRNTLVCITVGRTGDTLNMGFGGPHQIGRHRMRTYRSTSDIDGVRFLNPLDDLVMRSMVMQFRYDPDPA